MIILKTLNKVILLFLLLILLTGCKENEYDESRVKEKLSKELEYMEEKTINMLNSLNNISLENYEVTEKEIEIEKENNKEEKVGITQIKEKSVLENDRNSIDWENIKNDIELVDSAWNICLTDLLSLDVNEELLSNFSDKLNSTIIAIKDEDKELSLYNLSNIYSLLVELFKFSLLNINEIKIKEAKAYLIEGYIIVEKNKWEEIDYKLANAEKKAEEVFKNEEYINKNNNKIKDIQASIGELKKSLIFHDIDLFYFHYEKVLKKINKL